MKKIVSIRSLAFAVALLGAVPAMAGSSNDLSYDHVGFSFGSAQFDKPGLNAENVGYDFNDRSADLIAINIQSLIADSILISASYSNREFDSHEPGVESMSGNASLDQVRVNVGYVFPLDFYLPTDGYVTAGIQHTKIRTAQHEDFSDEDSGVVVEIGFKFLPCDYLELTPYVSSTDYRKLNGKITEFGLRSALPLSEYVDFTINFSKENSDFSDAVNYSAGIDFKF